MSCSVYKAEGKKEGMCETFGVMAFRFPKHRNMYWGTVLWEKAEQLGLQVYLGKNTSCSHSEKSTE